MSVGVPSYVFFSPFYESIGVPSYAVRPCDCCPVVASRSVVLSVGLSVMSVGLLV